jgi:predicted secreted protein
MGLVRGNDVILYLPYVPERPMACARSITFNTENELIETSIKGSGRYRTYLPGALSYSGTIEGLVFLVKDDDLSIDKVGLIQFQDLLDNDVPFHFSYFMTDGNIEYRRDGLFYIESINETSSFDNMATFTVNFKGTGPLYTTII